MGASKRLAEIAIQVLNQKYSDIKFSMVRFGNVINSSGSVIPLFLDQISRVDQLQLLIEMFKDIL